MDAETNTTASKRANQQLTIRQLPWYLRLLKSTIKSAEYKFYENFAEDNGFTFQRNANGMTCSSSIFKLGGEKTISNLISGAFGGQAFRFFVIDLENLHVIFTDTVIELQLSNAVPPLLITQKDEMERNHGLRPSPVNFSLLSGIDLNLAFGQSKFLQTENQEFNSKYLVYIEPGNEVDGLQVLTPDVIEILNDKPYFRDIETAGDKLYIYLDGAVVDPKKIQDAFALFTELSPKIRLVSKDFAAHST